MTCVRGRTGNVLEPSFEVATEEVPALPSSVGSPRIELEAAAPITRAAVVDDSRHLGHDERNAYVELATRG